MSVALVTGASGGIGLAFAELLARDGYDLVLAARSGPTLDAIAADYDVRYGVRVYPLAIDLAKPDAADRVAAFVAEQNLTIDVLVNNAGYATYGFFKDLPLAGEVDEIELNVVTLVKLTKLFLGPMVAKRAGKILNVASTAAFQPGPAMATYYATKAFVLSFSEAIANELAGTGVTVTCLCPGATASGFQERANMHAARLVRGRKLPDAMSVAVVGYAAMKAGKPLVIPGALNAAMAFSTRFAPRQWAVRIARFLQEPVS